MEASKKAVAPAPSFVASQADMERLTKGLLRRTDPDSDPNSFVSSEYEIVDE